MLYGWKTFIACFKCDLSLLLSMFGYSYLLFPDANLCLTTVSLLFDSQLLNPFRFAFERNIAVRTE